MPKTKDAGLYEYYVCKRCKRRIHYSKVPNSTSGNIICCNQTMTEPGHPPGILFWAGMIVIVAGGYALHHNFGWWLWAVILLGIIMARVLLEVTK